MYLDRLIESTQEAPLHATHTLTSFLVSRYLQRSGEVEETRRKGRGKREEGVRERELEK